MSGVVAADDKFELVTFDRRASELARRSVVGLSGKLGGRLERKTKQKQRERSLVAQMTFNNLLL